MQLRQTGRQCLKAFSVLLLVLLGWPGPGQTASPYRAVQQGNALYQDGKYAEAAHQYATAGQAMPEAAAIPFNQGNAAYKQQDYRKAHEHYTRALRTADRHLESRVKYNLGNVAYQQALQALQRPQEAMSHLRSAMTYYRDSLDVDPQQQDARYNLELAHLLLHQLQQQQAHQQQAGQQQTPPDGQQQDQQQSSEQPQASSQEQTALQEQQDQQAAQPPEASQESAQSPEHARTAHHELSPAEATRLLENIRERAREAEPQRQQRRAKVKTPPVDKDW